MECQQLLQMLAVFGYRGNSFNKFDHTSEGKGLLEYGELV